MIETPPHRLQGVPIKIALIECGLSQRDMAALLGMPYTTFNMKLRGERIFTEPEKQQLSDRLGKPLKVLFPSSTDTESEQNTQAEDAN